MTAGTTGTSPSSTVNPLWFAVKKNRAFFAFAWPILIFFSLFAALFEAQRQNILQNRTDAQIIVINRDAWLPTELSNWYPWEATTPACSTQWKKWRCWQPCFFAGGPEGLSESTPVPIRCCYAEVARGECVEYCAKVVHGQCIEDCGYEHTSTTG